MLLPRRRELSVPIRVLLSHQRILSHKTLRGPRAGLIFFRKDGPNSQDLEKRVNDAVFPACQGGPHNNVSTAILALEHTLIRNFS